MHQIKYFNLNVYFFLSILSYPSFADPSSGVAPTEVDYTYFNVGWGGVRSSNLPYALEPGKNDDDVLDYSDPTNLDVLPLCYWGGGRDDPVVEGAQPDPGVKSTGTQAERRELNNVKMKGYTTFADKDLVVKQDFGNAYLSTMGPPCRKDGIDTTISTCTQAQIDSEGYTRMQLKVNGNSNPNCIGTFLSKRLLIHNDTLSILTRNLFCYLVEHPGSSYRDADGEYLAVGLQCNFHDEGFATINALIYSADRCAPWTGEFRHSVVVLISSHILSPDP